MTDTNPILADFWIGGERQLTKGLLSEIKYHGKSSFSPKMELASYEVQIR